MSKYSDNMKTLIDWLDQIIDNELYDDFKEVILMNLQGKLKIGDSDLGDMYLLNSKEASIEEKRYMLKMLNKRKVIRDTMTEEK